MIRPKHLKLAPQSFEKSRDCGFLMPGNNSEQKEKTFAGISLTMTCGSKMTFFY